MKIDKFQTAGRLAAALELNKPRDERGEMRPLTPAQIREREFEETKARRYFQRRTVEDVVAMSLARILWPDQYGKPSEWDANVLIVMDDEAIREFAWPQEKQDRLIRFRDALRARDRLTVWSVPS
jgi:hypothetical protein